MRSYNKWAAFFIMFVLANCVSLTVNVYFPTQEIRDAAEQIEERVRSGQGADGLQSFHFYAPASPSWMRLSLSFGVKEAYAQRDVDISIETPAIKQIISSRTKRYKEIEPFLDSGVLAEGMDAFLTIRDQAGLDLKALTQLKKLMKDENDDRAALYREILSANKLDVTKENLDQVQEQFVKAIRNKMKPGHYYQVKKDVFEQKKKEQ